MNVMKFACLSVLIHDVEHDQLFILRNCVQIVDDVVSCYNYRYEYRMCINNG